MDKILTHNKIQPHVLGLMLSLSFLPLFQGGIDHDIIYWVLLLLLGILAWLSIKQKEEIILSVPLLWLGLFSLWAGISIFWSLNPHRTLVEFLQIICYGLIFVLAGKLNDRDVLRVGRIVLIASVGIALLGVGEYIFAKSARIHSTFLNPNPLGVYMAMCFCLAWGYYLRSRVRVLMPVSLLLLTALFLTGSRGAFLALVPGALVLLFGLRGEELFVAAKKTILCCVVALIITQGIIQLAPYVPGNDATRQMFSHLWVRSDSFLPSSVQGRLTFWKTGLDLVSNKPLYGYGLGTYYLAYFAAHDGSRWYSRYAHNQYLQTAAELGIPGCLLFLGFLFAVGRQLYKLRGKSHSIFFPGIIGALVTFIIHIGMDFSWNFPGVTALFFALAGAAAGGMRLQGNRQLSLPSKYIPWLVLLLFLLTGWQFSALTLYKHGVKSENNGKIKEALHLYRTANGFYPLNPMGYSFASDNYVRMYNNTGEKEFLRRALLQAKQAVEISPLDGYLQNQLGKIYWALGNAGAAEKHLILGTKFGIYFLDRYLDLANFYVDKNRLSEAKKALLAALELKEAALNSRVDKEKVINQLLKSHLGLARIYNSRGQSVLAREHQRLAQELKSRLMAANSQGGAKITHGIN